MRYEPDGSIPIYIQKDKPGIDKGHNWLPAPDEEFYLILRMHGPTEDDVSGKWQVPAVKRVN